MALQLLGLPWLAVSIGTFFSGLLAFFAKFVTKRVAIVGAAIGVILTITATFIAAIEGLLVGIAYAAPDFGVAFAFFPPNMSACVSAIITAKILKWAYSWNVSFIQMKLF